jgi:hypothetical protein
VTRTVTGSRATVITSHGDGGPASRLSLSELERDVTVTVAAAQATVTVTTRGRHISKSGSNYWLLLAIIATQ